MAAKRLYRSHRDRILGGVAGGIADYFDIDPTLVRLAWVLLAVAGGAGILAYIIAWIIIPEAPWRPSRERESAVGGQQAGREAATSGGAAGEAGNVPAAYYEEDERSYRSRSASGAWIFGVILVAVGLLLLLRNFWTFLWAIPFWPIVLILVGAVLLAGAFRQDHYRDGDRRGRKDE